MLRLSLVAAIIAKRVQSAAQTITGVASVIDGDTIEINNQQIHLHGIDAPERRQLFLDAADERWRCGQRAAFALADEIGRTPVECRVRGKDRYGRAIASCAQPGQALSAWRAHRDRRNLWAGRFDMPWDWRRAQRGG